MSVPSNRAIPRAYIGKGASRTGITRDKDRTHQMTHLVHNYSHNVDPAPGKVLCPSRTRNNLKTVCSYQLFLFAS